MIVKDLLGVVYDVVHLYVEIDNHFVDLYEGMLKNIPSELLLKKIKSIGGRNDGLDIRVD